MKQSKFYNSIVIVIPVFIIGLGVGLIAIYYGLNYYQAVQARKKAWECIAKGAKSVTYNSNVGITNPNSSFSCKFK